MPQPPSIPVATVEALLLRLYIGETCARTGRALALRDEDRKKAIEVAALVSELARISRRELVIDAAAGHAYTGLCAAELLGISRLVVLERSPGRAERCRQAATRLAPARPLTLEVHAGEVGDPALWPAHPDVVLALHACGSATDDVIDRAVAAGARRLLLVPCCHGVDSAFLAGATALAASHHLGRHGELRRRLVRSFVDGERALRLEKAGYAVELFELVPTTVTPENLVLRARYMGEPRRMAEAAREWSALTGSSDGDDGGGVRTTP